MVIMLKKKLMKYQISHQIEIISYTSDVLRRT